MASFRPYRPALGIEAALSEIRQNAGTQLDLHIVSICEALYGKTPEVFEPH
ncbi:hypothetical protein RF679_15875 [Undibacterium cyanobacteriorum]|uniref:Uncharacterized protein n=1 Tax=Undibacterium cyanobacteriorum TaxID=3073561 RepID=A0ABY9RIJ7_9BURK|nr:hypothetical protein [Undibacterium sp. 20NA77.5]WMW80110.1 hypothetical protein RF679_15875 [Undibacterium sp. 20NA77.5]